MAAHRDFPPRLMPAPVAAHYLGVSESMLYALKITRRKLGGKRVYDKADLDAYADSLPYEGETEGGMGKSNVEPLKPKRWSARQ